MWDAAVELIWYVANLSLVSEMADNRKPYMLFLSRNLSSEIQNNWTISSIVTQVFLDVSLCPCSLLMSSLYNNSSNMQTNIPPCVACLKYYLGILW